MRMLVWDGPVFKAQLARHGANLHVTYDDLDQPCYWRNPETGEDDIPSGTYASIEVAFGARVAAESVREAQSFVDRGWARYDDEPGPAVPIPEPIPIPPAADAPRGTENE